MQFNRKHKILFIPLFIISLIIKPIIYLLLVELKIYRKNIVYGNLSIAFPDIGIEDKKKLATLFYKNFFNYIYETIKLIYITKSQLKNKISYVNNESFKNLKEEENGAIIVTAHFFNWEYAGILIGLSLNQPTQVVYKTLTNSYFDGLIRYIRTKFGNQAVAMEQTPRSMIEGKKTGLITFFLADQTPMINAKTPFYFFLNKNVPFFDGYSKLANKLNLPVYFGDIERVNKKYLVTITKVEATEDFVPRYIELLENAIKKHPENWLWTHRRFKRAK